MSVQYRIRRYRQPYHAIELALEYVCGWLRHPGACVLLNPHGGWLSAPYQWAANRAEVWEPIPSNENGAA